MAWYNPVSWFKGSGSTGSQPFDPSAPGPTTGIGPKPGNTLSGPTGELGRPDPNVDWHQPVFPSLDPGEKRAGLVGYDPRGYRTGAQTSALAEKMREMLPKMQEDYLQRGHSRERQGAKLGLQEDVKDIRESASSRGLLYSGLRQGSEAAASAERSSEMARGIAQVNRNTELMDMANKLDLQAIDQAFDIQNMEQQRYDLIENEINLLRQQDADIAGALGGFGGNLLGRVLGNRFGTSTETALGANFPEAGYNDSYADYSGIGDFGLPGIDRGMYS